MTDLRTLISEAQANVKVEISDWVGHGLQWRIGEIGYAVATITNNTGLTLRNFYAQSHQHGNHLAPYVMVDGYNEKFEYEFLSNHKTYMAICMAAVSPGENYVHIHFTAEFVKMEYDDVHISYKVEVD